MYTKNEQNNLETYLLLGPDSHHRSEANTSLYANPASGSNRTSRRYEEDILLQGGTYSESRHLSPLWLAIPAAWSPVPLSPPSEIYWNRGDERRIVVTCADPVLQTVRQPNPAEARENIDSPPFEPPSPLIERQKLPPQTESSLRRSCAVILQESNEPAQFYEDVSARGPNRSDRNRERVRPGRKAGEDDQTQKTSSSRHKRNQSDPDAAPQTYTHIPTNAAASFEQTAMGKTLSQRHYREHVAFEPLEPTHTTVSPVALNPQDPQRRLQTNVERRPKTSTATGVDRSEDTSTSTTRTNTTYDRGRSTGLTSAALTPGDGSNDKCFSQRISEQILQDGTAASLADATAKSWMAQELAKRRAETASAPPPSRAKAEPERPQSRAGSIKEGIKQYIRPRASQESMRSVARSDSGARDGKNGGTWWRGGSLRRQGSNKSFRDGQTDEKGRPLSFVPGSDLNRALPALPGLDNWQEKKKPTMHIAHLMRGGSSAKKGTTLGPSVGSKKSKEKPTIVDDEGMERTLSRTEERLRQKDLKQAVEEKMLKGAIVNPSISADLVEARQKSLERQEKKTSSRERKARRQTMRQSVALTKTAEVAAKDATSRSKNDKVNANAAVVSEKAEKEKEKEKPGLRKRLSRFMLGSGAQKSVKSERKGFGRIAEYDGP